MTPPRSAAPRVLITGAGSGFGLALAQRYARDGARVACVDIDPARAEAARAGLQGEGHLAHAVDVADDDAMAALHARIRSEWGGVDVVLNNAGIASAGAMVETTMQEWRRVIDNVLLPAEILGLPVQESRSRARDLLALVGLEGSEDKYPYELSGGMQQRAAIARALIHDPKLILMDEPFGALDALTREKMNLELLDIWSAARKTIVFVTHGITEAVFLGTRVVVLTPSPARMADNFRIELPHPRTLDVKTSERFGEYARRIYRLLGMD